MQDSDRAPQQFLQVARTTPAQDLLDRLALPAGRGLILLNGGTAPLPAPLATQLAQVLTDGLARVAAEAQLTVITGGTAAGIFALFGQGRAKWGGSAPCIGVAVADLVAWPGRADPTSAAEAALEPNHSHFVLVNGQAWGDETQTMYALAAELSKTCPAIALFAGGGEITIHEMQMNVAQKRTMILLAGSGRATDKVLAARNGEAVEDARLMQIAQEGKIIPFALTADPAQLARLVRREVLTV